MATVRLDIISIGTLSRNRLWNENQPVRTAHATTSLIRAGKRNILVDPGLPAAALGARLFERTGVQPGKIDTVFLTNFRPAHRAGLAAFSNAKRLIHEVEQQSARQLLERLFQQAPEEDIDRKVLQEELELLETFSPAEDELVEHVDLFPLFGYTPGTCGLLVEQPTVTILVAGDAVPTQDHFLAGQLLPDTYDLELAKESLREVYEIADLIVPGHDNWFLNPRSQGM
jgi:glyoxylase-like metal-dependent hydrolase (beta-lactamase superfamily II)